MKSYSQINNFHNYLEQEVNRMQEFQNVYAVTKQSKQHLNDLKGMLFTYKHILENGKRITCLQRRKLFSK